MSPQENEEDNQQNHSHYIKIIIIATKSGVPLVSLKVDENWEENIIAPFLSALHGFSEQKLGSLGETLVKAGDLDMYVRRKHNLMLIVIMDEKMKKLEIGKEADMTLDLFYDMYQYELTDFDDSCPDLSNFEKFEHFLERKLNEYYSKVREHDDRGFFSKLKSFFGDKTPEIR